MGFATGTEISTRVAEPFRFGGQGPHYDQPQIHPDKNVPLPQSSPPTGFDYLALAARATNDAVRDWTVSSGALAWPQGLATLFGYTQLEGALDVTFWRQRIHPADRTRIATSLRDALGGQGDHWSAEYRFRCADGTYLQILERACITRNDN